MTRTWVTGSAHDNKPLDWLFDLRYGKDIAHITEALEAALDDAGVGDCQTAMLAAECVAFLRGGPADLHEDAHRWLKKGNVVANEAVVELTLQAIERVKKRSELEAWWRRHKSESHADWLASLDHLAERVKTKPAAEASAGPTGDSEIDALADDFESAKEKIKIRLMPGDHPVDPVVFRPLAPGLIAVLYYDLDERDVPVPISHAKKWSRPGGELFQISLDNAKADAELKIEEKSLDGIALTAVFGRDMYTAALALRLEDFMPTTKYGALVGIPFAGAFVFHPITHKKWMDSVKYLVANTAHLHEDAPDPLTTDLYWYRDGKLTLQPARETNGILSFEPSRDLLDAVSDL